MRQPLSFQNPMAVFVACLLGLYIPGAVDASLLGKRETIHRIQKIHVVEHAVLERRALTCPVNHYACAASLGGECCPDRYGCATDSCFVTTAGTGVACGKTGYYPCPLAAGPGCCPEGYLCGRDGFCTPPEGATWSVECPTGNFQCPLSNGGGCCQSGMACGNNLCYATSPATFVFTKTSTIVSSEKTTTVTTTITTISTPVPSLIPTDTKLGLPKLFVTSVPKIQPVETGLTSAQIGGIAGGAGALVLIIIAAAFFIWRRHRKQQSIVAESTIVGTSSVGGGSSKTGGKKVMAQVRVTHYPRPTQSTIDAMEYDELLQNSTAVPSVAGPDSFSRANSDIGSIPSPRPTPDSRHMSVDSSNASHAGYFDLPAGIYANRVSAQTVGSAGLRSSIDSSTTGVTTVAELMSVTATATGTATAAGNKSSRHFSNASELSYEGSIELPASGLGSPDLPAELGQGQQVSELHAEDGASGARRRSVGNGSSGSTSLAHPPMVHQRVGQQPLDVVSENAELLHGYYGASEHSGQTQVGLALGQDISSPLETRFQHARPTEEERRDI